MSKEKKVRENQVIKAFESCLNTMEEPGRFKWIATTTSVEDLITLKDGRVAQVTVTINTDEDEFINT